MSGVSVAMTVEQLDDESLRIELMKQGLQVGPVVSSTRDFYKKKLSLCLSGAGNNKRYDDSDGSNAQLEEGEEEEEEEEDEEDDDDQPAAIVRMSPMVGGGVSPQSSPVMGTNSGTEDVTWGLRHRMEDRSVSVSGQEWAPLTTEDIQETRVKGSAGVPGVLETGREIEVALVRSNKGSTTCDWLWRAIITVFKLVMLCGLMFVMYVMLTAQTPQPNVDQVAEKIIEAGAAQHKQLEDQLSG